MPVQILNQTPLALAFMAGRVRHPAHHLTVMVKGAFTLSPGGGAVASERPLFGGDEHWDDDAPSSYRYASDFAPFKPRADVTLTGTCHAAGGRAQATGRVALRIGPIKKTLLVFGDRRFVTGRDEITEPAPFRTVPLRYEGAFGGPGHAANPLGKGFGESESGEWPLPNLELPSAPIRSRNDRPAPAGFGPMDRRWSQRASKLGTYDREWLSQRWPDFPADFDWSYFNAAPEDQQVPYLRGDEPFSVEGMRPEGARFDGQLPGLRARCFLRRAQGGELITEEVVLNLDTVAIDADAGTLVLLWRGLFPVQSREYPELEKALLVTEPLGDAARPAEHYLEPALWEPATPSTEELGGAEDASARAAPVEMPPRPEPADEPDPAEVAALDQERADLAAAGVAPAILERLKGVTKAAVFSAILIANLPKPEEDAPSPEAAADGGAQAAKKEPDPAEAEKEQLKKELDAERAQLRDAGVDPALLQKLEAETTRNGFLKALVGGLPPPRTAEDERERKALLDSVAEAGEAERAAELAGEATPRAARGERLTREEALAIAARGGSLAGANLTELDLSGADLRGVNLSGANLTSARLVQAILTGADLTRARLRLAELSGAELTGAVLEDAHLESATLTGAKLSHANLGRAVLTGASLVRALLEQADLTGAHLDRANLSEAVLTGALLNDADIQDGILEGARASKASFRGARLGGAKLGRAELDGALFIEAELSKATLDGASLRQAHFEGAVGEETSFRGADLTNVRASGARFVAGRFGKVSGEKSNWSSAELTGADFEGAMLARANFTGASLSTTSFHLARLEEANLSKAVLAASKLSKANLFRARLGGADLTGADCRASNLFECDLFEAVTTNARFERANLKRTRLAERSAT